MAQDTPAPISVNTSPLTKVGLSALALGKFRTLCVASIAYLVFVILFGAFVRATGSGAGCGSHWPLCDGQILPKTEMTAIIEYSHRLTSGLSLILVFIVLTYAFRLFPKRHPARGAALVNTWFLLFEAAIGAGLVLLELVGKNDTPYRALVVGGHLINTFLLLASACYVYWLAHENPIRFFSGLRKAKTTQRCALFGCLILLSYLVVGASGGIVALGDTLFPASSLASGIAQDFESTSHFLIRLRVWHPIIAISVSAMVIIWCMFARQFPSSIVHRLSHGVTLGVVVQVIFGMANMIFLAPVWMQIVHLLIADLIWIGLVFLVLELIKASPECEFKAG